jgi:hypothetical protein
MKQDQMSMAASIESRVPFLDHELVQWVSALPERMKLRGVTTKHVLREAMRPHLPAEILGRKKMGFPVPVGAWFRGPYRHLVEEYVLGSRALARGLFEPRRCARSSRGTRPGRTTASGCGRWSRSRCGSACSSTARTRAGGLAGAAGGGAGHGAGPGRGGLSACTSSGSRPSSCTRSTRAGASGRTTCCAPLRRDHRVTYLALDDGTAAPDAAERARDEYCHDLVTVPFAPAAKGGARFFADLARNVFSSLPYAVARYRSPALRRAIERRSGRGTSTWWCATSSRRRSTCRTRWPRRRSCSNTTSRR